MLFIYYLETVGMKQWTHLFLDPEPQSLGSYNMTFWTRSATLVISVTEPFEYVWVYAGVRYLFGTVLVIEIYQFKKKSHHAHRAPAAPAVHKNVFQLLHKPPLNDCLETWNIKIS